MKEIFHRDDKTGQHSDTTLRTWLLFLVFFSYAVALGVVVLLLMTEVITVKTVNVGPALELLKVLGIMALGGGGLYLGKRWNESSLEKAKFPYSSKKKTSFDPDFPGC